MKVFKRILEKMLAFFGLLWQVTILVFCMGISLIIFSSSAESLLGRDIVYAGALSVFPRLPLETKGLVVPQNPPNLSGNLTGDYGKPVALNIPSIRRRLEIVPAIYDKQNLLVRPNNGHFLVKYGDDNQVEEFVIYLSKSWRTLPELEGIKAGTNIYVDTSRKWRYVFRIEEVVQVGYAKKFVVPHSRLTNLILIINNVEENNFLIIRGEYRTVITVER